MQRRQSAEERPDTQRLTHNFSQTILAWSVWLDEQFGLDLTTDPKLQERVDLLVIAKDKGYQEVTDLVCEVLSRLDRAQLKHNDNVINIWTNRRGLKSDLSKGELLGLTGKELLKKCKRLEVPEGWAVWSPNETPVYYPKTKIPRLGITDYTTAETEIRPL